MKQYTLEQLSGINPQVVGFVKEVLTTLKDVDLSNVDAVRKDLMLDGNTVEVIFSENPLKVLGIPEEKDSPYPYERAGVLFIHGIGFSFVMDKKDFDVNLEKNADDIFNQFAFGLNDILSFGMSRYIYSVKDGIGQLIAEAVDNEDWDSITHLTNGIVSGSYHKYGYTIIAADGENPIEKIDVLKTFDKDMVGKWKPLFIRDLEEVIVKCLKLGLINKNAWSAPLFKDHSQEAK